MQDEHTPPRVKTLLISLEFPAEVYVSSSRWDPTAEFRIRGIPVDGNDTPWLSFADLLIDLDRRLFVGVTFQIDRVEYFRPMKELADRLDPRVVRYNDLSSISAQTMYPGESGRAHRFEITWTIASNLAYRLGQLNCGQWFWWYARNGNRPLLWPVIAFGMTDIDDILAAHDLSFPDTLDFPPLEVEFFPCTV